MASEMRFVALEETDRQLRWCYLPLEVDYHGLVISKLSSIFCKWLHRILDWSHLTSKLPSKTS